VSSTPGAAAGTNVWSSYVIRHVNEVSADLRCNTFSNVSVIIIQFIQGRAYFSVLFITICAVVKSKCAVEQGDVCTKKCWNSGKVYDMLCADYQLLCSGKSCLKYALIQGYIMLLLFVCVCACVCVCTWAFTHVCKHVYMYICTWIDRCLCVMCVNACTKARVDGFMHLCTHNYMQHICKNACFVCVYCVYACIYQNCDRETCKAPSQGIF